MAFSLKGFRKIHVSGEDFLWKVRKKISHEEWHNDQLAIPIIHADGGQIFLAYVGYSRSGYGEFALESITPAMIRKCILEAIGKGWQFKVPGPAVTLENGILTSDVRYDGDMIVKYPLTWICKDCKHEDVYALTKTQAAFELWDKSWVSSLFCRHCYSSACESVSVGHPELDRELLDLWGNDAALYLMPQDEEIFLAEEKNLPLLLKAIDEAKYLPRKVDVLVEAICILLYDYTVHSEEFSDLENKQREKRTEIIRPELTARKDRIMQSANGVMDYIQKVVFPQIGIVYP